MKDYPARERWRQVGSDAPREEYFRLLRDAVVEFYLADPTNPYQQSGRSSGAQRWEETRRVFVRAIHRSGDFLDVGCANGLLLDTLIAWAAEEGFLLRPHGLDLVPELVELARQRFPGREDCFAVANAFYWTHKRQYDFVRTNLEYVPESDWIPFLRCQYAAVAPGGRLIVGHYRNPDERWVDVAAVVERAGFAVSGRADAPISIAWIDAQEIAA